MATVRDQDKDELVAFYHGARRIATTASKRWGRQEVAILVLSAITAGSLVGLLSELLPKATLWLGAAGGLLLLWVLVRLSLSVPATVDRGTVQVFSTWPLTRGRTLALLAIAILLGMPIFLRLGLPMLIPDGIAQILGDGAASVALRCLACLLGGLVQLPILAGALSFIYRRAAGSELAT